MYKSLEYELVLLTHHYRAIRDVGVTDPAVFEECNRFWFSEIHNYYSKRKESRIEMKREK